MGHSGMGVVVLEGALHQAMADQMGSIPMRSTEDGEVMPGEPLPPKRRDETATV